MAEPFGWAEHSSAKKWFGSAETGFGRSLDVKDSFALNPAMAKKLLLTSLKDYMCSQNMRYIKTKYLDEIVSQVEAALKRQNDTDSTSTSEESSDDSLGDVDVEADDCVICFEEMSENVEALTLSLCGHQYHETCIRRWMEESRKDCPLCRGEVVIA